mgnify:CR=1 FL=1
MNDDFFNTSSNPDMQYAIHLPMHICSPLLVLNRPSKSKNADNEFNAAALQTLQFRTAFVAPKPVHAPKKRKIEAVSDEEEEVSEKILAQEPLPLPEPEEPPTLRLTRAKRVDRS